MLVSLLLFLLLLMVWCFGNVGWLLVVVVLGCVLLLVGLCVLWIIFVVVLVYSGVC